MPGFSNTRQDAVGHETTVTTTPRNLVLCFDGTGQSFNSMTGIGTYDPVWTPSGIKRKFMRAMDAAVAWDLGQHVKDGYTFLMQYYQPGDKIYLFGFSRGAYTARALAGFLQQTGLLLPGNEESVNLAYQIYSGKDKWLVKPKCTNPECTVCGELLADAFKRSFCRETHVHFIGVWDTVASVGALIPRSLPFAQGGRAISHFRHALSLDEHRAKFEPQLWIPDLPPPVNPCSTPLDQRLKLTNPTDPRIHNLIQINYTDIKELWFAGCHADDGGGQTPTDGDFNPRLSHITLRWMVREAFNAGLCLDTAAVTDSPIYRPFVEAAQALADKGDVASTKKLSDEDEDPLLEALVPLAAKPSDRMRAEALAPRGDALDFAIKPKPEGWISGIHQRFSQRIGTLFWWFLEILPLFRFEWSVEGAVRKWTFWPHLGHGRRLPEHVIFHESVEMRQNAKADDFPPGDGFGVPETHYIPKAQFRRGKDKPYVYDS